MIYLGVDYEQYKDIISALKKDKNYKLLKEIDKIKK